jgi:RNA polymerase sigma factor (sigma-70 family)
VTSGRDPIDALYRTHAPRALSRARRMLGVEADACEVVHDVFLSLFERPEQFRGESSMSSFLYAAVTHACLNRIRNRDTRARLLREHGADAGMPSRGGLQPEELATLRGALARIPEPLAQVAVYYYMDELTHEDIARILGCSRRQVGNLLERLAQWTSEQARQGAAAWNA